MLRHIKQVLIVIVAILAGIMGGLALAALLEGFASLKRPSVIKN